VEGYSLGEAARILNVSPARLRSWERTTQVVALGGCGAQTALGFKDLVSLRAVRDLVASGVPLRRIRRSLALVRERMPEVEHPAGALRVRGQDSPWVVVRHDGALYEPDGQMLLDFDGPAEPGDAHVPTVLADRSEARAHLLDRAAEWFERGCKLDSERATFADAIDAYERALAIDPDFADAHCNLGSVYYSQDRRARARECFERAIACNPHHLEAHLNLATLMDEAGQQQSALVHYRRALAIDALYADTHVSLALLYEKLGLRRRGREHWRRYLQLEPGGAWQDIARRRLEEE